MADVKKVKKTNRRAEKGPAPHRLGKATLMDIAATTLEKIEQGSYDIEGDSYNLAKSVEEMKKKTTFYSADSSLSGWVKQPDLEGDEKDTVPEISVAEYSTLTGIRTLAEGLKAVEGTEKRVGALNFASAKNPGGGFLTGAQAQVSRFQNFLVELIPTSSTGGVDSAVLDNLPQSDDQRGPEILHLAQEGSQEGLLHSCDDLLSACPPHPLRQR